MKTKKKIEFKCHMPWLLGGYDSGLLNDNNSLFSMCGYLVKEEKESIIVALGESEGRYLHQIRVPMACVQDGKLKEQATAPSMDTTHVEENDHKL